jgi:hypothetical protein
MRRKVSDLDCQYESSRHIHHRSWIETSSVFHTTYSVPITFHTEPQSILLGDTAYCILSSHLHCLLESQRCSDSLEGLSILGPWMDSMSSGIHPVQPSLPRDRIVEQDTAQQDRSSETQPEVQVPLYWQHRRLESYASVNIERPSPIILEDHTERTPGRTSPSWAKEVVVDGYVVISGKLPSLGDYIVWNCKINTLDVGVLVSIRSGGAPR